MRQRACETILFSTRDPNDAPCIAFNGSTVVTPHFKCLYISSDTGTTWSEVEYPTRYQNIEIVSVALSRHTLFVGTFNQGFFRTDDNGETWDDLTAEISAGLPSLRILTLAANDSAVFVGTQQGVYRSVNNGSGWSAFEAALTDKTVKVFAVEGGTVFAGTTEDGVFRSIDNGASWTGANTGITGTYVWSLAAKNSMLFAGINGRGILRSTDGGAHWNECPVDSRAIFVIDRFTVKGNAVFAEASTSEGDAILRSLDEGGSWTVVNPLSVECWSYSLTVRNNDLLVSTCDNSLFQSADNGSSWTPVDGGSYPDCPRYNTMFATDNGMLWYTCSRTLYRSGDGGETWKTVDTPLEPDFFAVSGETVVAVSSYQGVYRSVDNGNSFTPAGSGLPEEGLFVKSFTDNDGCLYMGTNRHGVYVSTDNGLNWKAVNSGLPDVPIAALEVCDGSLFAGTTGFGIWRRPLDEIVALKNTDTVKNRVPETGCTIAVSGSGVPRVVVTLAVARPEEIVIRMYTMTGREVTSPLKRHVSAGPCIIPVHTGGMSPGCYTIRVQAGAWNHSKIISIL